MKENNTRVSKESHLFEVMNDDELSIFMIDLPLSLPGFEHQITSWLLTDKVLNRNFLIDVGPAAVNPTLEKALGEAGISSLDFILLTHIHLDHAGGIGHLLKTYPHARVVVPYKGKKHLIDPERLWQGSIRTLGEMVFSFGEILAISEEDFATEPVFPEHLRILETPGHASHHQSFLYERGGHRVLFPGEAAGVILSEHMLPRWTRGTATPKDIKSPVEEVPDVVYMYPASPPVFDLDIARGSLSKLRELESDLICYSHYGFSRYSRALMELYSEQLELWASVVRGMLMSYPDHDDEDIIERSLRALLASDRFLYCYDMFDADVKSKEHFFLVNSLQGFLGFFRPSQK
ncbi:MAG: MBL fold metallo-hydrolase [Synergistales bacterium]|nr:MBL fold metallo-hydrolase [Synergistales bacterium]